MSASQLTVYQNGPDAVSGPQLNTFMQTCDTATDMRAFIGVTGVSIYARGIAAANDGMGGAFYWNATAVGPDDDVNTIVPLGTKRGAWVRIGFPSQAITTIAALRALRGGTGAPFLVNFVTGYYVGGDGGGGMFWYNPTDTTSADNGGTIIVDVAQRRWYREQAADEPLNLLWFGGRNQSDNSPLLNAALAVATTLATSQPGVEIVIPAGNFIFASAVAFTYPSTPFGLKIRGAGSDITVLTWPNTDGISLQMSLPQHTIHMSDMTLASGGDGASNGIVITQSTPQALFGQNEFERLTFRGSDETVQSHYWNTALKGIGLGNVNCYGLLVYGRGVNQTSSLGFGVDIAGQTSGANPFAIVWNFTDCSFWQLGICIQYGTNVQGVSITACNFTNSVNGVFQPVGAIAGAQLAVTNSQFACFGNGIIQGGALNNIQVTNSLFLIPVPNASAIALAGTGAEHTFTGNVMSTFGSPEPGTNGLNVSGAALSNGTAIVTGNTFQGFVTAVNLTGAGDFYVQGNRYVGNTNTVLNPGGTAVNNVGIATE